MRLARDKEPTWAIRLNCAGYEATGHTIARNRRQGRRRKASQAQVSLANHVKHEAATEGTPGLAGLTRTRQRRSEPTQSAQQTLTWVMR